VAARGAAGQEEIGGP
jgi:hypothetical protein